MELTEKRFTIKPQDDYFGVTDNYSADKVNVVNGIRTEIEAEWLIELLNQLNDENEQLKSRIKDYDVALKKLQDLTDKKLKENEQLKQAIAETEKMVQSTYDELTKLRCIKNNLNKIKNQWNWIMEAIQYD